MTWKNLLWFSLLGSGIVVAGGGLRVGHVSPGPLFVAWLLPGVPPPGPFG